MKSFKSYLSFFIYWCFFVFIAIGQTTSNQESKNTWQSIVGKLVSIDQTARKAVVKTSDNKEIAFEIGEKTIFLRIKPNEKNLDNAVKISVKDITQDSQILARGIYAKSNVFVAQMIVVVSNNGLVTENNTQKDSIQGIVTAIDSLKKQIKINAVLQNAIKEITIDFSSATATFYKYSNTSLKFVNSVVSNFSKVKVGDQLKAVGRVDSTGSIFTSETIVFGTFKTIGGKITAVESENRFEIEDFQTKKKFTVEISNEATLKILEQNKSKEIIENYFNTDNTSKQKPDLKSFLDKIPSATFNRLTVGDSLLMSVSVNEDETVFTAYYLLKDVSPIFKYLDKLKQQGKPLPNLGGLSL
jgi:hypothetical protein